MWEVKSWTNSGSFVGEISGMFPLADPGIHQPLSDTCSQFPSLKKTTQLSWWHTETVIPVNYIPPVELQQWPHICLSKLANLLFAAWLTFGIWMWPLTFRADKWLTPTCGEQAQGVCVCEEILLAMWQFSYCVWPQRLKSFDLAFWHEPSKHTHCCISMHTPIFCHFNYSKFKSA